MMHSCEKMIGTSLALVATTGLLAGCLGGEGDDAPGVTYERFADGVHAVMEADRTVYTQRVIQRLVDDEGVIEASEHFDDDKALPLPAQMFRFGSEEAAELTDEFTYSLLSLWPINEQNEAATPMEEEGLQYVVDNPGENFYGEEELGGTPYFTAVYPDVAVADACVDCHNNHRDTPRTDFEIGDVMGGVVVRIPMD